MRDYIVEVPDNSYNRIFLLKSKNAKEAVNSVWEVYFKDDAVKCKRTGGISTLKNELQATTLDNLYRDTETDEGIVCLI